MQLPSKNNWFLHQTELETLMLVCELIDVNEYK